MLRVTYRNSRIPFFRKRGRQCDMPDHKRRRLGARHTITPPSLLLLSCRGWSLLRLRAVLGLTGPGRQTIRLVRRAATLGQNSSGASKVFVAARAPLGRARSFRSRFPTRGGKQTPADGREVSYRYGQGPGASVRHARRTLLARPDALQLRRTDVVAQDCAHLRPMCRLRSPYQKGRRRL
jgi:hypothetical protein